MWAPIPNKITEGAVKNYFILVLRALDFAERPQNKNAKFFIYGANERTDHIFGNSAINLPDCIRSGKGLSVSEDTF
jgi:hypothetical protein